MHKNFNTAVFGGVWCLMFFALFAFGRQARAQDSEIVTLRYQWQPGETFHYSATMNIDAAAVSKGYRANVLSFSMSVPISLEVLRVESNGTARIAVRYGEVKMSISMLGQTLDVRVPARNIKASLNGESVPTGELVDLRASLTSVQKLIRDGFQVTINDRGQVLDASSADEESERHSTLELFELPEYPLRVGDKYVMAKTLAGNFAGSTTGSQNLPLDRPIDVERVLTSIENVGSVRQAKLESRVVETFQGITLDDCSRADVDVNMRYLAVFDVTPGCVAKETGQGTIGISPRDRSTPPIQAKLSYEFQLVP